MKWKELIIAGLIVLVLLLTAGGCTIVTIHNHLGPTRTRDVAVKAKAEAKLDATADVDASLIPPLTE